MCHCYGSRSYATHTEESDGEGDAQVSKSFTEEDETEPKKRHNKTLAQTDDMWKPVLVDLKGIPYGTMKKVLEQEVKLLAKDLDPRHQGCLLCRDGG